MLGGIRAGRYGSDITMETKIYNRSNLFTNFSIAFPSQAIQQNHIQFLFHQKQSTWPPEASFVARSKAKLLTHMSACTAKCL